MIFYEEEPEYLNPQNGSIIKFSPPEEEQGLGGRLLALGKQLLHPPGITFRPAPRTTTKAAEFLDVAKENVPNLFGGLGQGLDELAGLPGRVVTGSRQEVPRGFSEQVGQATSALSGNEALGQGVGLAAAFATPGPDELKYLKSDRSGGLTTKFLEYIKGKKTISRQEIMDFARRPELKKGEADLLTRLGSELKESKIPAQEFADSIRRDLLELKPVKVKEPQYIGTTIEGRDYSSFQTGLRTKNYEEVVYESPITTNGSSHFPNSKNYFAHARGDEVVEGGKKIWREQEIQSDLLQKEGLEKQRVLTIGGEPKNIGGFFVKDGERYYVAKINSDGTATGVNDFTGKEVTVPVSYLESRNAEIEKLSPFTNDRFGERIMRERIKEKASKGYSKYRLPTGETIGKIEGFGETSWYNVDGDLIPRDFKYKVGDEVIAGQGLEGDIDLIRTEGQHWIITDILGDGRFKAVPKDKFHKGDFVLSVGGSPLDAFKETFDLTGKSNPQYRRYSDWGKFLKNKYGGKEVTDARGNTWMEIDLKKEQGRSPVEAFGSIDEKLLVGTGAALVAGGAGAGAAMSPNERTVRPGSENATGAEDDVPDPLVGAIAHLESRGVPEEERYTFSKPSGKPNLGRDMGKYQITEGELRTYGKRYLGRVVEPEEFLASPALQDEYIRRKVEYLRGQGVPDAEILRRHRGGQNVKAGAHQGYVDAGLRFLKEND